MYTEYEIITEGNIKRLENGAIINRYTHVVRGAYIGKDVMIGEFCYVAKGARIGDYTRIQNHVSVWDGVEIGKNCFIAPKVTFTNCNDPAARLTREGGEEFIPDKTIIGNEVTICAAVVIVAPCSIGSGARVGAGSIVLRDIAADDKKNGLIKKRGAAEKKNDNKSKLQKTPKKGSIKKTPGNKRAKK